jgi:hypothetical protein
VISWPLDLVNAVARRRAVIFIGAGVSMNSADHNGEHPPSWKSFLTDAIATCTGTKKEMKSHLKSGDFLTCCQLVKYRMGDNGWLAFVEGKFFDPDYQPTKIHEILFDLDASIVVTPNVDRIYDRFAQGKEAQLKIKTYDADDVVRAMRGNEKQRLILKIHGSAETPNRLIFTREDYASARQKFGSFYRALDALIVTHTFIFVGCGMTDPDLSLLLENYAYSFASAPPHYFVSANPGSTDYGQMLARNFNLYTIGYNGKNDHAELTESLERLVSMVDDRRNELAATQLW